MSRKPVDWEALNAYVDGELDTDSSAAVAEAVADDPKLARQISLITRLKAATAGVAGEAPAFDIPDPAAPVWPRVAAVLAVVMVGAAVAVAQLGLPFTDEPWLTRARADHVEWAKTSGIAAGRILDAGDYLTGLRALGPRPQLPDLSANRLRIKRVTVIPTADGRPAAIHVGYTGTRGCRVSLWISKTGQSGSGLLVKHRYGNPTVSWHTGGLRYVLVASSMKQQRFDLVAGVSYETTVARSTPDEGTRVALALSRAMSPPCKA